MHLTVKDISDKLAGKIIGNSEEVITGVSNIENAKPGDIAFALEKEITKIKDCHASCVILKEAINDFSITQIIVDDPYLSFIQILKIVEEETHIKPEIGIHPTAVLSKNVKLGNNVRIGAMVYIGDNTIIGDGAVIHPLVFIGENVKIGANSLLYSHVSIRESAIIGRDVILHSGCVLGSDGFGYRHSKGKHVKVPQVGKVIIEDEVEIGANAAIDRATVDVTIIKKGTKIDNLVHIGHNSYIGENVLLAAQVGTGGSCKIDNYSALGGQVGVKDHVYIGEGVNVGAKAGVIGNVPSKSIVWGMPARPLKDTLKSEAYVHKLPELFKKIKELEEKIKKLEEK